MTLLFANNAEAVLAVAISNSDTTLQLDAGSGDEFPNPGASEEFYVTLQSSTGDIEICLCTARSGDSLTVTRGQESTTAVAFAVGSQVANRATAETLTKLRTASENVYNPSGTNFTGTKTQTVLNEADARLQSLEGTQHSHPNKAILDLITDAGSGAIITSAERTKLSGIETGAQADQSAVEVPFTPYGDIAATNVQAALEELDDEKVSSASFPAYANDPTDYVEIAPTFDYAFTEDLPEAGWASQLSFTRTTAATYFDRFGVMQTAAIGVLRIDYDPETRVCLGALMEQSSENIILESQTLDQSPWATVRASVTANDVTAPDGTLTADKIVEDSTAASNHQVRQSVSFTTGLTYTWSEYVRADERDEVELLLPAAAFSSNQRYRYNLTSETATFVGGSCTGGIKKCSNGWYRIWITATATATAADNCIMYLSVGGTITYNGDGSSGLHSWGHQIEAKSYATSYIVTTTASVTRDDDVMNTVVDDWYDGNGGTFFVKATEHGDPTAQVAFFGLDDGTANEQVWFSRYTDGIARFQVYTSATYQAQLIDTASIAGGIDVKATLVLFEDDFAMSVNGRSVVTDSSGLLPAVTQLQFGARGVLANQLDGHIERLIHWPTRVNNTIAETITQ